MECPHCRSGNTEFKPKAAQWECLDCERRFEGEPPAYHRRHRAERATRRAKIFLSYGHDRNAGLVSELKTDLEKRGHEVWIDYKDIGTWEDWRGNITRGIIDSELAVAFLSRHSTRDPGVCRNEIAIALHHFGIVYPVLLEAEAEVDPPVTITHLQMLDLSRWNDIRDGKVPGEDWERWYEEKLLSMVDRIEGEGSQLADQSRSLRDTLRPENFDDQIARHVPGFVGRQWILDDYTDWLERCSESRVFWLIAGPGFGKTAFAANLADQQRGTVAGTWFCESASGELRDAKRAIRTLAFQLALRWEDYRDSLLKKLGIDQPFASYSRTELNEVRDDLSGKDAHDLFRCLLLDPLTGLIEREHPWVILIDALDEATDESGDNPLADLLSQHFARLPAWIRFVVTSRPEAAITSRLEGFRPRRVEAQDRRNVDDLHEYFDKNIARHKELEDLANDERARIKETLIGLSEGMILYLKMVEQGFSEGSLELATLNGLEHSPKGLFSRYGASFRHRFGSGYGGNVATLLRLLVAAPAPLSQHLAQEVLDWNSEQYLGARNAIGSYAEDNLEGIGLFHKTLRDWLTSTVTADFHLDPDAALQMVDATLSRVERECGPTHERTAEVRNWMMRSLHSARRFPDLLRLARRAAESLRRVGDYGPGGWWTLKAALDGMPRDTARFAMPEVLNYIREARAQLARSGARDLSGADELLMSLPLSAAVVPDTGADRSAPTDTVELTQGDVFDFAKEHELLVVFGHTSFNLMGGSWMKFKKAHEGFERINDPFTHFDGRPQEYAPGRWVWFIAEEDNRGVCDESLRLTMAGILEWASRMRLSRIATNGIRNTDHGGDHLANRDSDDRRTRLIIELVTEHAMARSMKITLASLNDVFVRNAET